MATDGSLQGKAGKWGACGWAVVQLDYNEEMGPLYGMYGSMEAELEIQRTIKRAELTALLCLLKRVIGPIKVHVTTRGLLMDLEKERECIKPIAGGADFMDRNLGSITSSGRKRHFGRSRACKGASHEEGTKYVAV